MQLSSWIHRAFSAIFVSHYRLSGFSWNLNCYICRLWDSAFRRTRGTLWCLHGAISWLWTTWKQCCKYTRQLARLDELATEGITSLLCWLFSTSVLSKEKKPFKLLFTSVSKRIQVENLSYGNERARKTHFNMKRCAPRFVLEQTQEKLGNGLLVVLKRSDLHFLSRDLEACDYRKDAARFFCWR